MQRASQYIFLLRDSFSSFTITSLVPDVTKDTLKTTFISSTAELKAASGCTVRVDGAASFTSLVQDKDLLDNNIHLEVGRLKNRNKNPVAEKVIQELKHELRREYPDGHKVNSGGLAVVTARLNLRVRDRGLNAREIVFQFDGLTGEQLNIDDKTLATQKLSKRISNHVPISHSQAKLKVPASNSDVNVGDLIFVKSDGDKHTARDKYIVTSVESDHLRANKLVGSQFRSKSYKLNFSEVYPVPTRCDPHVPIRDRTHNTDSSSSSDDRETVLQPYNHESDHGESSSEHDSNSPYTASGTSISHSPPSRPKRPSRLPGYLRDNYVITYSSSDED